MELFSVDRYTVDANDRPKAEENVILDKLLHKVEKRKERKQKRKCADDYEEELAEKRNKGVVENKKTVDVPAVVDNETIVVALNDDTAVGGNDFMVLGEDAVDAAKRRQKMDMILPPWLAHPTIISTVIAADSADASNTAIANMLFLAPHIRNSLKELNVTRLFPVQNAVVPWILEAHAKPAPFRPRDICVSAPTGSGKTLAFAIPIVQLLAHRVQRKVRALIVLPVAELALQVFKVIKKLCEKTELTACLLSKQCPFSLEAAKLVENYKGVYYSKIDIVVSTPGRLVDHLHATNGFCLKSLQFIVIDEADRIMDAVFQNWIYHLDEHVRATSDKLLSGRTAPLSYADLLESAVTQPHKLLFSATLSQDPEKLQNLRLFHPKLFTSVLTQVQKLRDKFASPTAAEGETHSDFIGNYTTPSELEEKYCITESRIKPLTLFSLITQFRWTKFLCFTNSAESSSRLAFVLQNLFGDTLRISELSGSISASARASELSKFSRGKINGLICSDALARGIDIPNTDIVISYDVPRHIKTYIHRIGRTARAGRRGTAITLVTQKELGVFNKTLAEAGKQLSDEIHVTTVTEEQYAHRYSEALLELRKKLEKDVRTKAILKDRAKQRSNIDINDPKKLTLMEQLQGICRTEAHKEFEKQEQSIIETANSKNERKKKLRLKKFNASAGKLMDIQK